MQYQLSGPVSGMHAISRAPSRFVDSCLIVADASVGGIGYSVVEYCIGVDLWACWTEVSIALCGDNGCWNVSVYPVCFSISFCIGENFPSNIFAIVSLGMELAAAVVANGLVVCLPGCVFH